MENVNITINGMPLSVPANYTILEAARLAGIEIPTLCHMKGRNEIGACRICVVEVEKARSLVAACVMPVSEGMVIKTNSKKVMESRKMTIELLLSNHNRSCLQCVRSGNCELQTLAYEFGVEDAGRFDGAKTESTEDTSAAHLIRDNSKCILCRRCVAACHTQTAVIGANNRGFDTVIGSAFNKDLNDVACISCGQCITACPTGALRERDDTQKVFDAINDPTKHVVIQTAPAVRAALGEEFGMEIGTNVEGKMVAALRRLGFDKVFDTDFSADLTIMEEANEFLDRVQNGGVLPLITSCSPGWIRYCEQFYPDMLDNLSSCKSPQQMFGAVVKTYYAEKNGIDPKDIFSVSVMPCTAKKYEIARDDQSAAGVPDLDATITTRELARMIKKARIQFTKLPDEQFDNPLGEDTGAAVIFGATGGVMEAALRTAVDTLTGKDNESYEFTEVRGMEGVKEATYDVAGLKINVAVASGTDNAKKVLDAVKSGEKNYHFIEIMGCPGGCINGGGQPIHSQAEWATIDIKGLRAKALYDQDAAMPIRKSHQNPMIKTIYDEYFEKPGSHKAHKVLHTSYKAQTNTIK